jgi:hypothetical protein
MGNWGRESETHTDRETDTQTERQTHRQREPKDLMTGEMGRIRQAEWPGKGEMGIGRIEQFVEDRCQRGI